MRSLALALVGVVLFVGMVAVTSLGIAVAGNEEMCVPMGTITLEPPDSVEAKRSAVAFPHGKHFVLACNNCHHTWKGAEPITGCMTAGCHDLDTLPKKEDPPGIDKANAHKYFKNAYHGQCIGCHKEMKAKIEKMANTMAVADDNPTTTGPTGCVMCHPKE